MALEWEKKSNGQVGQFSFRIPAAPLQYRIPTYYPDLGPFNVPLETRVRVQTQNRTLLDQVVDKANLYAALEFLRTHRLLAFPGMNIPPEYQYVAITMTGGRSVWSGYLNQSQIDNAVLILQGKTTMVPVCPPGYTPVNGLCVPARASYRYRGLFGTPGTLGEAGASVSVGGGLIGLAILGLAGYAVYKLVT